MNQPDEDRPARFDAVCLGEAMVLVRPVDGRIDPRSTFVLRAAGAESNVAMYLAALGHRASWVSQVGDDPFAEVLRYELGALGVDTSGVRTVAGRPTGLLFKDPTPLGTKVYYYRHGSAASELDHDLLDGLASHPPRVLHLTGISAAISLASRTLVEHLVHDRPLDGTLLSFDVNHRVSLWDSPAGPVLRDLAQGADVVFVGLDEAGRLWGTATPDEVRTLLDAPPVVVVKDGALGATSFHGDRTYFVPARAVAVVEAVGAGDAFAAGWLSGHLRGLEPAAQLRLGHLVAVAALSSGDDVSPPPGRGDLDAALAVDDETWAATPAGDLPGRSG